MQIVVREPDGRTETFEVVGRVEIGREAAGLSVEDPSVSRRHLAIEDIDGRLRVTDLGSTHGTTVNGRRIDAPTEVGPGDRVVLGDTVLTVLGAAPGTSTGGFDVVDAGGVEVRFRRGTVAERLAPQHATRAATAWQALVRLVPDPAAVRPVIHLVDPFADPSGAGTVTSGSIVDGSDVWTAVTAELPPEEPARALAVVAAAHLPAADEVAALMEGYGLHLAGVVDTDPLVRQHPGAPEMLEGEARAAAATSFVRFLVDREGEDAVVETLSGAEPGRLDAALTERFGRGLAALQQSWLNKVMAGGDRPRPSQFLRMSWRYIRKHRVKQAEIFVYMLLSLAFTASFPFVTQRLFDSALPESLTTGEFGPVFELLVVLAVAFTISLLAGLRQAYLSAFVSGAVIRDIRQEMFDRLQHLPTSWFHRYQQGEVLQRLFGDVRMVEAGLSQAISQGLFQALSLVVSAAIMMRVNPLLGGIVLVGAPIVALVYRSMSDGAQKRSLAVQEESSALLSVAAENHGAQPVVKLFGLAGREKERFARSSDRSFRSERRLALFSGLFGLSVNMIVTTLRLIILGLGAWLIIEGRFTVGGLVAFLAIMGEVLSPVTVLTGIGQGIQESTGALVRINEVLDTEVEPAGEGQPGLPRMSEALVLDGISFAYTPEKQTLRDVSCRIEAGTKVAFVGPSGSGKSTVLRLLMRLHEPGSGRILIDGVAYSDATLASLRDQLGVVFQDPFLFDTTIRENIALGRIGATDDEVVAAASAAEVDSFIDALPRGYDTLVGEGGAMLSGGQRQRVSIARALIRNPQILLLDEATSALDPQTERQITDTLNRLGAGRTTVAITHRLTSVTDYDKICVIVDGELVEEGGHAALVAAGGVYARLWAEQTGEPLARPPFDPAPALARLPLFADLDEAALDEVAERLQATTLRPGDQVVEGGGALRIVTSGRAEVLTASGEPMSELGVGDVFGLSALLGDDRGLVLRATESSDLLLLDDEAIAGLMARHPSIGRRMEPAAEPDLPATGTRVGAAAFATASAAPATPARAVEPSTAELRRATGAYPQVRR